MQNQMAHSVSQVIRVRLDLREIHMDDLTYGKFVWVAVDLSLLKSVQDFKNHIYQKFHIGKSKNVQLYIKECLLPPDETILLLRDEDLVKVVYEDITLLQEQQAETYNNHQNFTNTGQRKQKKFIEESLNPLLEKSVKKKHYHTKLGQDAIPKELPSFTVVSPDNCGISESVIRTNNGSLSENNCTVFNSPDAGIVKNDFYRKKKRHKSNKNDLGSEDGASQCMTVDETFSAIEVDIHSKDSNQASESKGETVSSLDDKSYEEISECTYQPGSNCKKRSRKRQGKKNPLTWKDVKYRSLSVGSCLSNLTNNLMPRSTLMLGERSFNYKLNKSTDVKSLHNKHIRFEEENHSDKAEEIKSSSEPNKEELTIVNSRNNSDKEQEKDNFPDQPEKEQTASLVNNTKDIPLWMIWENPHCSLVDSSKTDIHHSTPTEENKVNAKHRLEEGKNASLLISNISQNLEKGDQDSPQPTKRDFQNCPIIHTPPVHGNVIAYKILELSDSYCPEVSDYKEGRVINYNSQNDTIELELINEEIKRIRSGKFEVDGLGEDATVKSLKQVSLLWPALIEPRLVSS